MEHQVEIPNPNHAAFFKNPEMNAIITDVWEPVLLSHRHPFDTKGGESFFYVLKFEGFDDGLDFFHAAAVLARCVQMASLR